MIPIYLQAFLMSMGFGTANFAYEWLFNKKRWERALEITFFQVVAVFIFALLRGE